MFDGGRQKAEQALKNHDFKLLAQSVALPEKSNEICKIRSPNNLTKCYLLTVKSETFEINIESRQNAISYINKGCEFGTDNFTYYACLFYNLIFHFMFISALHIKFQSKSGSHKLS